MKRNDIQRPEKDIDMELLKIKNDALKNKEIDELVSEDYYREEDEGRIITIYRYKFTQEFTDELFKFSKIHQYDHRRDFKDAWTIWVEDNEDIITTEFNRLKQMGYQGDILDKMFKSARYYFRKKSVEKKKPVERRVYISCQKVLLDAIDLHIKKSSSIIDFKPSEGFEDFCKEHIELLKQEVAMLCKAGITDSDEIKSKIKKTYKNRYFVYIHK